MRLKLILALMLLTVCMSANPPEAKAACFFNQQQVLVCTVDEQPQKPTFYPYIREQELQRAIILGNPPRPPENYSRFLPPPWLTRPEEIPKAYPLRRQNGEQFL